MKLFFCLCFLVATCGYSVGISKEYIYIDYVPNVNWEQAQSHCRQFYTDLATVTTIAEHQTLVHSGRNDFSAWIGLYRSAAVDATWEWSDGEQVSFLSWAKGWPLLGSVPPESSCVVIYDGAWYNDPCDINHLTFYCYRYLILVTELKTWEEALQYCATKHSGLVSMPNATQIQQAKPELALTQTDDVWVALRYLDGKWFWLSQSPLGIESWTGKPPDPLVSITSCPVLPYRCGAINTKTNAFEIRDCNEKMNFLCWK